VAAGVASVTAVGGGAVVGAGVVGEDSWQPPMVRMSANASKIKRLIKLE